MSWLLLDAGNTALKWALVSPRAWPVADDPADAGAGHDASGRGAALESASASVTTPWRGAHAIESADLAAQLATSLAAAMRASMTAADAGAPTAIVGCAVASARAIAAIDAAVDGAIGAALESTAGASGRPAIQWLASAAQFVHEGIVLQNTYRDPAQLGADRWHALIGARARYPHHALVIVNAGTATTVDGVDVDGRFLGGVIAPGIDLMRASLALGTARLPLASGTYATQPDNTDDAICTGIVDAQIGLIERRIRGVQDAVGRAAMIVLSGGSSAVLLPLLHAQGGLGKMAYEPDLVLRGLWHRARSIGSAPAAARPISN